MGAMQLTFAAVEGVKTSFEAQDAQDAFEAEPKLEFDLPESDEFSMKLEFDYPPPEYFDPEKLL